MCLLHMNGRFCLLGEAFGYWICIRGMSERSSDKKGE